MLGYTCSKKYKGMLVFLFSYFLITISSYVIMTITTSITLQNWKQSLGKDPPKVFLIFFCDGHLWLAYRPKKIKSSFGKSQNRYVVIASFLGQLYRLQNVELVSLGQRIWDKVKSCREHIGEHIGNLLETQWELEKPTNTPTLPQKKKKTWVPSCMLPHLIGCKNARMFWPSYILVILSLAKW